MTFCIPTVCSVCTQCSKKSVNIIPRLVSYSQTLDKLLEKPGTLSPITRGANIMLQKTALVLFFYAHQ